ncbi:zinc-ribbon domain-containing protein [Agrococcus beijingensis]|uniref:zinc-ribbon domain-containing protein n=1 Tax=Agrococcus beijingensis TaxID=3068634 RepID=UPI0027413F9F|nr:zinc-ribbon domain-containing protein [Agrococcus sp. REN33]
MLFIFGLGTKQRDEGPGQTRTCPRCGNTTVWARIRQHQQFSLFFIPLARWQRRDLEVCPICGEAVSV